MGEIKGILLTAWTTFLRNRYGDRAVSDVMEKLSAEDRDALPFSFLPSSWYPYDTLHNLRMLTRQLAKPTEEHLSVEIGRFMAEHVFTGVYWAFLTKDPIKQVQQFPRIGDFFFHEARKLDTQILGESRCLVRYRYESGISPTHSICESLTGFWSRTLELAGACAVKSSHPKCTADGAECCEFTFEWEAAKALGHAQTKRLGNTSAL